MNLPEDISTLHALIRELITTNELLQAQVTAQKKQLESQREQIASLQAEVKELRARLSSDSKNSHKPPSSDGYRKRAVIPKRKKKRGGQSGHKGSTLQMVSSPDHEIALRAERCSCGADLRGVPGVLSERRQVFDLPAPKLEVVEYQRYRTQCPCCGDGISG